MESKFSRRRLGGWALVAAMIAFLLSRTAGGVIDLDLFHEMALAREAGILGYVPWQDSFAYTPTLDIVVHHEWGLGMLALLLAQTIGGTGIIVLKFLLIFGVAAVVWNVARRRGAKPVCIAVFATTAIVLSDFGFATVRAQMFSYLFAACLLWAFDRDRNGDRWWLIGAGLLFPAWANLHGGVLVGMGLLAVHWFEQWLRRQPHWHLFGLGIATIALIALNPWGFHFHQYLIRAITMPRPAIAEWAPLWEDENPMQIVNFSISLLLMLLAVKHAGWKQVPGLLIVIVTGLAALKSNRFLPFYAIAFASYLPAAFSRASLGREIRRWWYRYQPALTATLGIFVVALVIGALPAEPWRLQVASHPLPHQGKHLIYPVGAVNYLANEQFRGNIMVPYDWGSYVMWKLGPLVKVSFDSRYEVAYPNWRMNEDDLFYAGREGWDQVLEKYPTDIVLARTDLPIVGRLNQQRGWDRVYTDPQFVLFARSELNLPVVSTRMPAPNGEFP